MYINDPVITLRDNTPVTPVETDLTEICSSCSVNLSKPQASGQNTYGRNHQRRGLKGLWDGSVVLTLHHDYDAGGITPILWAMLQDNEPWTLLVRAADAAISATNPEWVIPVSLSELPTVEGDPGELAASSITFELAGEPLFDVTV